MLGLVCWQSGRNSTGILPNVPNPYLFSYRWASCAMSEICTQFSGFTGQRVTTNTYNAITTAERDRLELSATKAASGFPDPRGPLSTAHSMRPKWVTLPSLCRFAGGCVPLLTLRSSVDSGTRTHKALSSAGSQPAGYTNSPISTSSVRAVGLEPTKP